MGAFFYGGAGPSRYNDKSISRKSLQHDFFDKLLQCDQCKNKPIKKIIKALSNHKTAESNTLPSVSALSLFGDSH